MISMVDKSTDHGKLLLICLIILLTIWRPFPLKFLGKSRTRRKEKNKLLHLYEISQVCILIDHSPKAIRAREIAQLL